MRWATRATLTLVLWGAAAWWSTTYAPIVDCYEQAKWDGRSFVMMGKWTCLK